jgi:hypothetical protein
MYRCGGFGSFSALAAESLESGRDIRVDGIAVLERWT